MKISLVFANGNGTFFAKTCKTRKNKSIHPHQPENEKLQLITEGGKIRYNDGEAMERWIAYGVFKPCVCYRTYTPAVDFGTNKPCPLYTFSTTTTAKTAHTE